MDPPVQAFSGRPAQAPHGEPRLSRTAEVDVPWRTPAQQGSREAWRLWLVNHVRAGAKLDWASRACHVFQPVGFLTRLFTAASGRSGGSGSPADMRLVHRRWGGFLGSFSPWRDRRDNAARWRAPRSPEAMPSSSADEPVSAPARSARTPLSAQEQAPGQAYNASISSRTGRCSGGLTQGGGAAAGGDGRRGIRK